jgi:hypothetical protein
MLWCSSAARETRIQQRAKSYRRTSRDANAIAVTLTRLAQRMLRAAPSNVLDRDLYRPAQSAAAAVAVTLALHARAGKPSLLYSVTTGQMP